MSADADAIVIGAGHNGLVAANRLAEHGWSVLVLEAQAEPGGAVRSGELCEPGFTSDRFSSFHPLAAASPVIRSLELERLRAALAALAARARAPAGRRDLCGDLHGPRRDGGSARRRWRRLA